MTLGTLARPHSTRRRLGIALVLVLLVVGCSSGSDVRTPGSTAASSTPAPGQTASPFEGDQSWVAYYGQTGTHLVHPDNTGDHMLPVVFDGNLILANWSPDGRRLVTTSRNTGGTEPIYEYDLQTQELLQPFACEDPCLGDDEPVYSPDGSRVLFSRALGPFVADQPTDCGLWLGDLATGEVEQLTARLAAPTGRRSRTGPRTAADWSTTAAFMSPMGSRPGARCTSSTLSAARNGS